MPDYVRVNVPGVRIFSRWHCCNAAVACWPKTAKPYAKLRFRTRSTTVPDRCHRHTPRSPPLPLDVATERFGFFKPLALDQVVIRPRHRAGRAAINPKANETRTGCLATKILGAHVGCALRTRFIRQIRHRRLRLATELYHSSTRNEGLSWLDAAVSLRPCSRLQRITSPSTPIADGHGGAMVA